MIPGFPEASFGVRLVHAGTDAEIRRLNSDIAEAFEAQLSALEARATEETPAAEETLYAATGCFSLAGAAREAEELQILEALHAAGRLGREVELSGACSEWVQWCEEAPQNLLSARGVVIAGQVRRALEVAKVPAWLELARDAAAEGSSVVLVTNSVEALEALCGYLQCGAVHGGQVGATGAKEREETIRAFAHNESPFIVVNAKAGGTGISLHDRTGAKRPRVSLISPPESGPDLLQVLDRTRRDGGGFAHRYLICGAGTVEEKIADRVTAKLDDIGTINDGDLSLDT